MSLQRILALAAAEARTIRRLARYWIFSVLCVGLGLLAYAYYGVLHGLFSSYSGSVGATSPKYLLAQLSLWPMVLFMVGIVFLAFDVRARDERERVAEVLDSRPYSNLELVLGRFLGTLAMALLPLVLMVVAVQSLGAAALIFDWPIGEMVVWSSFLSFLVLLALPALSFTIALVYLVSVVVRHRFAAAVVGLGLLGGIVFLSLRVPIYLLTVFDITGGFLIVASEVTPRLIAPAGLVQRGAILIAAAGLLGLAAAFYPRLDDGSRRVRGGAATALLLVAASLLALVWSGASRDVRLFDHLREVHAARGDEPVVDLQSITGTVSIEPGRGLSMEIDLRFAAPATESIERALFTLNPGLVVAAIEDESGRPLPFTHADGLLEIELPRLLEAGASTSVFLVASGRPNIYFAYLDASFRVELETVFDSQIGLLGFEPAVFDDRYVALMPGIRWLPSAGSEGGGSDARHRPRDLFELDLTAEVPSEWIVAGPGVRQEVGGAAAGRSRYRFAPPAPLPAIALLASRFERRAVEVEGVTLEILVHPRHTRNLEMFAEAGEEIRTWLAEHLREAADLGLSYPYGGLSLVEVPNMLRGYGGGWQLDTVSSPPGMLLMRETGFPTSRFDIAFRNPKRFEERDGGIARAKRQALERFFENDFNGDNIFHGAARNFVLYQASARGRAAMVLDFLSHDLANRLLTGKRGYFSAHLFDREMGSLVAIVIPELARGGGQGSVAEALIRTVTGRPEVWDEVLGVALVDMDPWQDPGRSVNVLVLKGGAVASSILDGLGREQTGALLASLRSQYLGGSYDLEDLERAAADLGTPLEQLVGDFLDETSLPGFVAAPADLFRLPDSSDGLPRYQLLVRVHNGEAAPGLLRLRFTNEESQRLSLGRAGQLGDGEGGGWTESEPVLVPARASVEMGLVLSKPPRRLLVVPYLSLNRAPFPVELGSLDEETIVEAEALEETRVSDWLPSSDSAVVVDDLDAGFRIEGKGERSGLRLRGLGYPTSLDQGLPLHQGFGRPPTTWSRQAVPTAWGRYRRSVAMVRSGSGAERAVFAAELPHSGRWRLELHMPASVRGRGALYRPFGRYGTYHLTLVEDGEREELNFDASAGEAGWNDLGVYDLEGGEVRVELGRESDGSSLVADAIRWLPLDGDRETAQAADG